MNSITTIGSFTRTTKTILILSSCVGELMKKNIIALLSSLLLVNSANAGVISQLHSNGFAQIEHFEEIGQSFTAIDPRVVFSFFFVDVNGEFFSHDDTLVATMYSGSGFTGAVMANRNLGVNTFTAGKIDVDFSSAFLSIGQIYTVGLKTIGTSPYGGVEISIEEPYAGGEAFQKAGTESAVDIHDLKFLVTGVSEAPEPSIPGLFGLALAGLGLARRTRSPDAA